MITGGPTTAIKQHWGCISFQSVTKEKLCQFSIGVDNGGTIVFWGQNRGIGQPTGIYSNRSGQLLPIVNAVTTIPDSGGSSFYVNNLTTYSFKNDRLAFIGSTGYPDSPYPLVNEGLFVERSGGALDKLADRTTQAPGGAAGTFTSFVGGTGLLAFNGQEVTFNARTSVTNRIGLYRTQGGTIETVADVHTPVPERPGSTFGDGFRLDVDGHTLAFTDSGNGVYKDVGAGLQKVADVNTRVPGSDLFSFGQRIENVSISNGNVAFDWGSQGVYIEYEGQLAKVIAQGDTLDGKVVNSTAMSSDALSGNRLAFFASFSDGSEGVYVATAVPEASEAAMLLAGLGVIGVIAHRRRQINDVV
ncbi:MAG: hypothetical protein J5X23_04285 [Candidatus Accumulibacter sp.]|uniref:DUF7453 family protein n=1 Tax=Accumulibacter sp. TaxID=2053492 RepID=UPI001B0DF449|nr:hypothetical protein [Accumulibacter sp.]MBO3714205.1 hypothetical protein [Accumulibacter sp.]